MAHNINTYVGRQAAWHALGTVTNKYMTTDELLMDKGFQYVVFKSQLHDGLGRPVNAWGTYRWNLSDKLAGDMHAAEFLGTVGEDYKVMQHAEGFKTIDALMRSADGAHYETAGVLGNGERVWALADLAHTVRVGDDVQKGYLLFSTGHDGHMSHSYRICMTRVVCQNTLSAALSEKTKGKLTVRHTKNAATKLTDARVALESLSDDVQRMEDKLNFLAGRRLNRETMTTVLNRLFPKRKNDAGEDKETVRRDNILGDILKIYELNDGNAFPEQRGTPYNLLNAITNYADHERSSTMRAESAMFGSGDTLKSKALDIIMETANGLPEVIRKTVVTASGPSTGSGMLDDVLAATVA